MDMNRRYVDRFKAEEDEFNRIRRTFTKWFITIWVLAILTGLGTVGVVIWAIVKMVNKFAA